MPEGSSLPTGLRCGVYHIILDPPHVEPTAGVIQTPHLRAVGFLDWISTLASPAGALACRNVGGLQLANRPEVRGSPHHSGPTTCGTNCRCHSDPAPQGRWVSRLDSCLDPPHVEPTAGVIQTPHLSAAGCLDWISTLASPDSGTAHHNNTDPCHTSCCEHVMSSCRIRLKNHVHMMR